ncbi:MAG: RecX family transcriptional regulator [Chloroflexota bacterium]
MGVITAIEIQKRNKERVNVYLDDEYAFSLTAVDAALLRKGQQLSPAEIDRLRANDEVARAIDHAVRFLSYRPRSTQEVHDNLKKKDFADPAIDAAVEKMQSMGYLDDGAFARYWLENRSTFNPRGTRALRYELRQKGVADREIEAALAEFDDRAAAYDAAQKRVGKLRGLDRRTFTQKLGSYLQRRGFNYSDCRDVIEQLENEMAEADPDFFSEDVDSHDF